MGAVVVRQEGTLANAKELDEREEKEKRKGRGKSYEIGERIPVEVCVGPIHHCTARAEEKMMRWLLFHKIVTLSVNTLSNLWYFSSRSLMLGMFSFLSSRSSFRLLRLPRGTSRR